MSGSASLDLERLMLGHTLAIAPMPTLARVYVALCQTAPTEAAGGEEVTGAGYARPAATFTLLAVPANAAANATAVDFPPATGDWGTVAHFEIWTQAIGGTRLYWGQLVDPTDGVPIEIEVTAGNVLRFSPGTLVVQATDMDPVVIEDAGPFLPTAGGTMTGPLLYPATGGIALRPAQDRAADVANVLDHGADPTGVADSTTALRHAIATLKTVYLPIGDYKITDILTLNNEQIMRGEGRVQSILRIDSTTFNLSAFGVVRLGTSETGATIEDIGIAFTQPQTTVRANIVAFPPAIYAQAAGRFTIRRVRVIAGNVGLDARGNVGGAYIQDFECGCLTTGMLFGGALDWVAINNYMFWPFGLLGNSLETIYNDGITLAADIGRVDGLEVNGWRSRLADVRIDSGAQTSGSYVFNNYAGDGGGVRLVNAYVFAAPGININTSNTGRAALNVTGGSNIKLANADLRGAELVPLIVLAGLSTTVVNVTGARLYQGRAAGGQIATVSSGVLMITSSRIDMQAAAFTMPLLAQSATGKLVIANNYFAGEGTGVGVSFGADVIGNYLGPTTMNNWAVTLPGTLVDGTPPNGTYKNVYERVPSTFYGMGGSGGITFHGTGLDTALPSWEMLGNLRVSKYIRYGINSGLNATGTTRADALQLAAAVNNVSGGTGGVILPAAASTTIGQWVRIYAAPTIKVYANGSETIDGVAGTTGVTLTAARRCEFQQISATAWFSHLLGAVST